MIRIARVITRLNIGGPTLQVFILQKSLNDYGFETTLYCGEVMSGEQEMTYHELADGIKPIRIKAFGRNVNLVKDLVIVWKLYNYFRKTKPSIVHTHQAKAGAVGRIAAWFAGVPIIVHTFHGNIFRGHFTPIKEKIFIFLERFLSHLSTAIIAINESQKQDLSDIFHIASEKKVEVIRLGFDLSYFNNIEQYRGLFKRRFNIGNELLLVGVIARLEPVKNLQFFLDVAKQLQNSYPAVRYFIIGDGRLRSDLEQRIKELGLEKVVIITGYIRKIWEALADLNVVALTSHSEGTPVSLIEAMSSGCAVISTAVGGVVELIDDFKTGLLVHPNDLATYVLKLKRLLEDEDLRHRLGKAAINKVRNIYTSEQLTKNIVDLYQRKMLGLNKITL